MMLGEGRHLYEGYLTKANMEVIWEYTRALLSVGPFSVITSNEGLGNFEPRVYTGARLREFRLHDGGFTVSDDRNVFGFDAQYETYEEATRVSMDPETTPFMLPMFLRFTDQQLLARHHAPAGYLLYWRWVLEDDRRIHEETFARLREKRSLIRA